MLKSLFGLINQERIETNATAELTPETPLQTLRVEVKNGQVKLRTWEHPWIQAQVRVTLTGSYVEEFGESNTDRFWKLEQRGQEAVFQQVSFTRLTLGSVTVDVELLVPAELEARVETHNGSVEIEQYEGSVRGTTHNGAVRLYDIKGNADLIAHNGKMTAERVNGRLRLLTHNGALVLDEVYGEVNGETHNGRIDATDCRDMLHLKSHNGSIRLRCYQDMNYNVSLQTHNGSITMDIPRSASAHVEMKTSLGGIKGDALTVQGSGISQKLNAKIGEGEYNWEIRTDRGAIAVNYAN